MDRRMFDLLLCMGLQSRMKICGRRVSMSLYGGTVLCCSFVLWRKCFHSNSILLKSFQRYCITHGVNGTIIVKICDIFSRCVLSEYLTRVEPGNLKSKGSTKNFELSKIRVGNRKFRGPRENFELPKFELSGAVVFIQQSFWAIQTFHVSTARVTSLQLHHYRVWQWMRIYLNNPLLYA